MITIEINKKDFNLPESWDELTFSQFIEVLHVAEDNRATKTQKDIRTLCAICKEEGLEELLIPMPNDDMKLLIDDVFAWLKVEPDYKKYSSDLTLEIDGVKYKLKANYKKLSNDEVITMEQLNMSGKYDLHHFEVSFGVLCRKLDENGDEMELSLDLLLETIMSLRDKVYLKDIFPLVFFSLYGEKKQSSKTLPSSSWTIRKKDTKSKKKATAKKPQAKK